MKVFTAALPFLVLAAALGSPASGASRGGSLSLSNGVHRPADCCPSYTTRSIRCEIMKDYFLTTSGCSKAAVIFKTRGGQEVCFHPSAEGVQECITKLASANTEKTVGEKKLY
ncbi:C-C motif chemokine 15-like [Artibeus jamaicensis]|uniref:C-C motif chemokine 15-like n=1 Tax=Artibeus jamaicensis TaxID=9417 RepID=UPI00235AACE9|nr:C-C motif chemokine 15-like [Artibeus jamaicensis]